tara:strand:- start:704 stop:1393 length:690 start_codon:yes stop_codon:yes gene_type:complete
MTFCINLDKRQDRWDKLKNTKYNIKRFSGVDAENIKDLYDEYGLNINPCNESAKLYFQHHRGGIGAYLSHYSLWKTIVDLEIQTALILEDDVEEKSIEQIADSNLVIDGDIDIINLSKRNEWKDDRLLWHGAESYILTINGARKLIRATHHPIFLENIIPQTYNSSEKTSWDSHLSITCPVDKFIGYCCEDSVHSSIKLSSYIYPIVDLNDISEESDINVNKQNIWEIK